MGEQMDMWLGHVFALALCILSMSFHLFLHVDFSTGPDPFSNMICQS
jgi:hypothetical protein